MRQQEKIVKLLQAKKRIVDTLQIYSVNDKNYQIY